MLIAENIGLSYGREHVFSDITLEISSGAGLAVVGKSGCGKSSLLYVLSGLRKPTTGKVFFDGIELWRQDTDRLKLRRRHFGFIFQQHFLINYLTVRENILVPSFAEDDSAVRADELIDELGLSGLESRFPYELSGGQRQRVALGRALINNPKVIFADEPTASLDRANAGVALGLIRRYQQKNGSALVLVTHDASQVEGFDHVLSLQ